MVLKRGSLVKLRAFGGKEIVRRFLGKQNSTVLICSDEEYSAAQIERRRPICVGFPLSDVIGVVSGPTVRQSKKSIRSKRSLRQTQNHHA